MRPSLYNDVHKGIRSELSTLLVDCGRCDPDSVAGTTTLCDRVTALQRMLEAHAGHEEKWIEPVLREVAPALATSLASEHVRLHEQLSGVDTAFASWRRAPTASRADAAAQSYAALTAFVAAYLSHMAREEHEAMPAIQEALADEEIHAVAGRLRASIPPPEMAQWLGVMLPAMNVVERTGLFVGMKMQAPPEVLQGVTDLAARVLSEDDWAVVRVRASL